LRLPDSIEPDSREPGILLLTTRKPGFDNGNSIRITNVIDGLLEVGSVHMCLIDSVPDRQVFEPDPRITTTVIRARDRTRARKLVDLFGASPSSVPYRHADALRQEVVGKVGRTDWDLVWCVRARVHELTRAMTSGPRIVDLDDLYDQLLFTEIRDRCHEFGVIRTAPRNAFDWVDAQRWRRLQKRIASEVDKVVICSSGDRDRLGAANAAVVPNGYPDPTSRLEEKGRVDGERPPSFLFVGPLTYEPNRLAVHWMVEKVLPRLRDDLPGASFTVVGDDRDVRLPSVDGNSVVFTGHVDDVEPYYQQATVAVVPLHSGGGTRLKVIEALARGVPLVSTSFGIAGIDVNPGRDVLIADDPATFASTCCTVATHAPLRQRLVEAGLERYRERLRAAATSTAVRQLAREVLVEHGRSSTRPDGDGQE
jgi:glycosyltransferase involved in cell wall biosynthesis